MRIIIGNVAYPGLDATSVTYKSTTADPTPTCSVALRDNNSSITIGAMQELLILDEKVIPNPTWNILENPSLNPYTTSWFTVASVGGITLSTVVGGGVKYTFSNAANTASRIIYQYDAVSSNDATSLDQIVGGQNYTFSFFAIATAPVNIQIIGRMDVFDAIGTVLSTIPFTFAVSTSNTRYSTTFLAPPGASYVGFQFSGQATNATNSGTITFTQAQLEAQWFPTLINYPSPWCGPAQTNCRQLPNGYWIRQYRKFAGFVNHAFAQDYHGNARTWHIDAVGYGWLLSMVVSGGSFVQLADSVIIGALIASAFPVVADGDGSHLFDATTNVVTGTTIDNLQSNWDDYRTLINGIAAQSGFFWLVDPYWSIVYQPYGYTQMPIQLIADNSANPDFVTQFTIYNWSVEMDFTQPGSAALIIGGTCTTQLTTALTNGTPVTTINVQGLPAPINNKTVISIGGNQVSTVQVNAGVGATSLNLGTFTPLANYGVGTSITTNTYVSLVFDPAQNTIWNKALYGLGTINNTFLRKINDSTLQSSVDTNNRGIFEILQYDYPRTIYHGITQAELIVGQGVQVTSATDNLNATTLLVQQVTARWIGVNELLQDVWEYQVDLGNVNRAASNIMSHIFRHTTKNTGAPAVTQTSVVALEKFSIVDVSQYPYPLTVLADQPIGYYRLGEGSGTTAYDISGNAFNGTISGTGVTYAAPGAILNDPDTGLLLDGVAGHIALPAGVNTGGWTAISVELWINLTSNSYAGFRRVIANEFTQSTNKGFDLSISPNGFDGAFVLGNGASSVSTTFNGVTFLAGHYYHIVCTWDGTNVRTYVNGALRSTSGTFTGTIGAPGFNVDIGRNPNYNGDFFPGTVDCVSLYKNVALSAARIAKHYNVGITGKA